MTRMLILGLALVTGLTACENPFSTVCTSEGYPSFAVTVVDSVSGENLAPDATVRVRDGAFVDTFWAPAGGRYTGVFGRAGTFEITVRHPGYLEWRRAGVAVREGECHVITREITARLAPES